MGWSTLTEDDRRERYAWSEDAAFVRDGKCTDCGKPVYAWADEIPCCGPGFQCTTTLYLFACDRCELVGDRF